MALRWTRLSCHAFRHNAVRLQLLRPCIQPRQLPALARPAAGGRALVADDVAREAGQDRRPDRPARALRRLPAGRGRRAAGTVRRDPAPDQPLARTARGRLIGVNDGAAGTEGRTMRRWLEEPAERPRPAPGSGLTLPTLPVIAPPFGLLVDQRPFEEPVKPRKPGYLGNACQIIPRPPAFPVAAPRSSPSFGAKCRKACTSDREAAHFSINGRRGVCNAPHLSGASFLRSKG